MDADGPRDTNYPISHAYYLQSACAACAVFLPMAGTTIYTILSNPRDAMVA